MEHGPGLYFTDALDGAKSYAVNHYSNKVGIVISVKISSKKQISGDVSKKVVDLLLDAVPNLDRRLKSINHTRVSYTENLMGSGELAWAFSYVWENLFKNTEAKEWLKLILSLGYDSLVIEDYSGDMHCIVYDPKILKVIAVDKLDPKKELR
jgi:hypothetical protein